MNRKARMIPKNPPRVEAVAAAPSASPAFALLRQGKPVEDRRGALRLPGGVDQDRRDGTAVGRGPIGGAEQDHGHHGVHPVGHRDQDDQGRHAAQTRDGPEDDPDYGPYGKDGDPLPSQHHRKCGKKCVPIEHKPSCVRYRKPAPMAGAGDIPVAFATCFPFRSRVSVPP